MSRLLVAAHRDELEAFPAELPGYELLVTGVGKLNAATGLAVAIQRARPERIVVVGTAGALVPARIGTVLRPGRAVQTDATVIVDAGGAPVSAPRVVTVDGGADEVTIGTADSFIASREQQERILAEYPETSLVDMESYAYAFVATRLGVPITILKAVSDSADEHAEGGWAEGTRICSPRLLDAVREL